MTFENLNLHPKILKAIQDAGYVNPTPIQAEAIPQILSGKDIRASAQTGTGKTGAFTIPTLDILVNRAPVDGGKGPRVLVLVPTRELAMQVANECQKYSKYLSRTKTVCIYGGAPYPQQNRELSRPYEILVATPGRLMDHYEQNRIDFSRLEVFILDEADRMLDMGFIDVVEQLAKELPDDVQTLMFSATMKGPILNLSKRLLKNPVDIVIEPDLSKKQNIEQILYQVDGLPHKLKVLDHLLQSKSIGQTIIFTSTKRYAEELVYILEENGHQSAALHGDMNQRKRTSTIAKLRKGDTQILVATDVAARGIDIPAISHVINFDLPINVEDYVHRIGRTGRAESTGIAISFAAPQDFSMIKKIESFTEQPIKFEIIPGLEATLKFSANAPSPRGKRRGSFAPRGNGGGQGAGRSFGGGNSRQGEGRNGGNRSEKGSGFGDKAARPRKFGDFSKPRKPGGSALKRSPVAR